MPRTRSKIGSRFLGAAMSVVLALGMAPGLAFAGEAEEAPQADLVLMVQDGEPIVEINTDGIPPAIVGNEYYAEIELAIAGVPEGTSLIEVEADESFAELAGFTLDEYEIDPSSGEGLLVFSGVAQESDYTTCELAFFFRSESGESLGEASASIDFAIESGSGNLTTEPYQHVGAFGVPFIDTVSFSSRVPIPESAEFSVEFEGLPDGLEAGAPRVRNESVSVIMTGVAKVVGEFDVPVKVSRTLNQETSVVFDGTVKFRISPQSLENLVLRVGSFDGEILFEGAPVVPQISLETDIPVGVKDGKVIWETVAVQGGYTVTYVDNEKAGEATATVVGDGTNITGEKIIVFEILPGDMTACAIEAIPEQTATGKAIEPAITVKCGENVLAEGVDYSVAYKDNVSVGTATATVTGLEGKFEGSQDITFQIALSAADTKAVEDAAAAVAGLPTAEAIASGDANALKKVDDAVAAFMALSDAAKSQIDPADVVALVGAAQKASQANAAKAEKAAQDVADAQKDLTIAQGKIATAEQAAKDAQAAATAAKSQTKLARAALTKNTKSAKKGKVTVAWKKVANATGYQVKVGKKTYTVKKAATVKKTVSAKKGAKVKVKVRAYKKIGKNTLYGQWSKAKTVKVKK